MTSHDTHVIPNTLPFSFSTLLQISLKQSWLSILASSTKKESSRISLTFLGSGNDLHINITTNKVITIFLAVLQSFTEYSQVRHKIINNSLSTKWQPLHCLRPTMITQHQDDDILLTLVTRKLQYTTLTSSNFRKWGL